MKTEGSEMKTEGSEMKTENGKCMGEYTVVGDVLVCGGRRFRLRHQTLAERVVPVFGQTILMATVYVILWYAATAIGL